MKSHNVLTIESINIGRSSKGFAKRYFDCTVNAVIELFCPKTGKRLIYGEVSAKSTSSDVQEAVNGAIEDFRNHYVEYSFHSKDFSSFDGKFHNEIDHVKYEVEEQMIKLFENTDWAIFKIPLNFK